MSKKRLKSKETCFYHVMTRTAQQAFWLTEHETKQHFIRQLDELSQIYYVDILSHVLMSNHYHIALKMSAPPMDLQDLRQRYERAQKRLVHPRPFREELAQAYWRRYTDLSWLMWDMNRGMAVAYNKKKRTKGHLWGSRFKSIVVEDGQALLNTLAYIELNPVRAGMVARPTDYPYSSSGRLKAQLAKRVKRNNGKARRTRKAGKAKPRPLPCLELLAKEISAKTYVDWIDHVGQLEASPDPSLAIEPIKMTATGLTIDMESVHQALRGRDPAKWGNAVYGSQAFKEATYQSAGHWIPIRGRPT